PSRDSAGRVRGGGRNPPRAPPGTASSGRAMHRHRADRAAPIELTLPLRPPCRRFVCRSSYVRRPRRAFSLPPLRPAVGLLPPIQRDEPLTRWADARCVQPPITNHSQHCPPIQTEMLRHNRDANSPALESHHPLDGVLVHTPWGPAPAVFPGIDS